ncbi:Ig domain-containing protein [Corynebacterium doosanense]|uniref:Uncharacterized protein n=1 Tax=Corynebacterium doosanense CAU 212 = DSM 45436 TaxID=558173 RepID=A0A097IJ85_9CORY|nr:Ig domain-containing protein [Corynebacterium doosanense]AIT62185.1 hypothetical protein CDOO_01995 [Corynebacterium doosanense CAU 212 = DSM 45436]
MNAQIDFMFEHPAPAGKHPYIQLFLNPLGMKLDNEFMNDLSTFIFDMCGAKLHDVEPHTVEYSRGWDDPRNVDEIVPGSELTSVWSPDLPPGLTLNPRTGELQGVLPAGPYTWTVHVGPQVKYDSLGGSGSPHEEGRWIGALEDRERAVPQPVDVAALTPAQREALLAQLQQTGTEEVG